MTAIPEPTEFTKYIRDKLRNDPDPPTAHHWERLDKYWLCRNMFKLCDIIEEAEGRATMLNKVIGDLNGRIKELQAQIDKQAKTIAGS